MRLYGCFRLDAGENGRASFNGGHLSMEESESMSMAVMRDEMLISDDVSTAVFDSVAGIA